MKKLLPLFLNESFRGVAISLLTLFSAVYIYNILLVFSYSPKIALAGAVFFYLVTEFFKFWANFLAKYLSLKYGLKVPIYLGEIFFIICLLTLFFFKDPIFLVFIAPLFLGISTGLYWFGRHGLMAKIGSFHHFGNELGMNGIVNTILLMITPIFGGFLISNIGYRSLFLVSLLFVVCSMLFLRESEEQKIVHDTNLSEILQLFKNHPRMFLAYAGNAASATVYAIIFPLYIYLLVKKEFSLGEFFTSAMILSALVNLLIGRFMDLKGKKEMILIGSLVSSVIWLGRFIFRNIPALFSLDIVDRLTGGMTGIPFSALSYQKAVHGHATGRAILFRELAVGIGAMSACLIMIGIIFSGFGLELTFIMAGIFSLTQLLVIKGENLDD